MAQDRSHRDLLVAHTSFGLHHPRSLVSSSAQLLVILNHLILLTLQVLLVRIIHNGFLACREQLFLLIASLESLLFR